MVYDQDTWSRDTNTKFTLGDCLFGAVKLTDNANPNKYGYSSDSIGFDACSQFSLPIGEWGKMLLFLVWTIIHQSILIIGKKDNLVLGEGSTDGLDNTTLTARVKCSVNITRSRKKICLSLHYNAANSFSYTNGVKIYQFKAKDSEIKPYPLCLGNISKDFTVDNMKNTLY